MRDLLSVNMLRLLFSRKWWWTTLLVILAVGVLARLGIWQLDRLAQRRAFNARVSAQIAQPPLTLSGDALNGPLTSMEYRSVIVSGVYDFSQQVALRNQAWDDGQTTLRAGVHLLTPLVIAGADQAVLVDRGWIPLEESAPEKWSQFDEPGTVEVKGVIRYSESHADFGSITDPPGHLLEWNLVTLPRIGEQIAHPLLPVYVEQAPDGEQVGNPSATPGAGLPYRTQPELDLSEGPHLGYAIQWFTFAALLGIGYPFYVRQSSQTRRNRGQAGSLSYLEDTP